jgi:hypothetical protein
VEYDDDDNKQVYVGSQQNGCTGKQIILHKLGKIMLFNSQGVKGSGADKCPCHQL